LTECTTAADHGDSFQLNTVDERPFPTTYNVLGGTVAKLISPTAELNGSKLWSYSITDLLCRPAPAKANPGSLGLTLGPSGGDARQIGRTEAMFRSHQRGLEGKE